MWPIFNQSLAEAQIDAEVKAAGLTGQQRDTPGASTSRSKKDKRKKQATKPKSNVPLKLDSVSPEALIPCY